MVKCQDKERNQELGEETEKDRAPEKCLPSAREAAMQEKTRKGPGGLPLSLTSLVPLPWETPTSLLAPLGINDSRSPPNIV